MMMCARYTSIDGTFAPLQIQELETTAKQRLRITRPSASYLLAMKCLAGRASMPGFAGDLEDIRFLIRKMGIRHSKKLRLTWKSFIAARLYRRKCGKRSRIS